MLHVICYVNLDSPVETIPRISTIYAKRLNKLGIKTVRDLIYHFPHRYEDYSKIVSIAEIPANETVTVQGKITNIKTIRTWKKKMFLTEAVIEDNTGAIKAVWFNQPYLTRTLKKGVLVNLSGKATYDGKRLYFPSPSHEINPETKQWGTKISIHTACLVPIYPETEKLSSKWLRYILSTVLPKSLTQLKDHLPPEIKKNKSLIGLKKALSQIHFPKTQKEIEGARQRLGFDELFLIQLFVLKQKQKWQENKAPRIKFEQPLIKNFVDSLPFKLTNAQRKAAWEILQDLERLNPMNRLLEGDVGSGKTIVAAIAALETAKKKYQVAFMAPTEILAQQHFKEISNFLKNQGLKIGLLTAAETKLSFDLPIGNKQETEIHKKNSLIEKIKSGQVDIIIGTHALIQENIQFQNLALVIVDEQHRFGVQQRAALQKNIIQIKDGRPTTIPHLLSMTATPIPRTLALTIYGDLDLSLLDELPKGRQKIITKIVSSANRQKAYEFIRQEVKNGRQIFVICPRIEKTEDQEAATEKSRIWSEVKAVKDEYEKLSKEVFPDLKIAMLHGRLKAKEKEEIMKDFSRRKKDILVSTSVVEVGIDIPNATIMMIEDAERFGLAQLHQFRGRVGRGEHQSYCFLFTKSPRSSRLQAILTAKNGFELAEKDLEIRGPGEFFGTRQWGLPDLSMASLTDAKLIKSCRQEANKILGQDPQLKKYPLLKEKVDKIQATTHLE